MRVWLSILILLSLVLAGCEAKSRRRAWGYLTLGPVSEFVNPETLVPSRELLVRYDKGGFSVMSTACTFDLTALEPRTLEDGTRIFQSPENGSVYSWEGRVLKGPAKAPLPYYRLELKPGAIGGPPDTLFARIGDEVPYSWRLPFQAPPSADPSMPQ